MRKRIVLLLLCPLLLTACADGAQRRAAEVQSAMAALSAYRAQVRLALPRRDETLHYAFSVAHGGEETDVTLTEPSMLEGVTAHLTDGALSLSYGGLILDAGTAAQGVNGVNCAPLLLRAVAEGYVLGSSEEPFGEEKDALFLVCESECSGEVLLYRAWFSAEGVPLYGEIEKNKEIIAFMEFTNFEACDTIEDNEDAAA